MTAYDSYLSQDLKNFDLSQEEIDKNLEAVIAMQ